MRFEYGTPSVQSRCSRSANKTAKDENEPGLRPASMKRGPKQCAFAAKLKITCKSHPTAGAISLRNINASVGDRLQGFARWVVIQLKRILKDCNHWLPLDDRIADEVETFDGEQRHIL